ncbi:MAG TPA: hypothetical protein VFE23_11325 [Usitatibacter sp.]|jgi:hypothetical protein|nr:hypothetical protein [Usitatibacter sp.]
MADEDDILGKADALLRRSLGTRPGAETGNYPVLTDFVDVAGSGDATLLAGEVSMQVMATVEARIANELERRVMERLGGSVSVAIATVLAELRPQLADIVSSAVAEALAGRQVK